MSLLGKLGYNISKGVCNFLAPLTAVSSMAGEGGDGVMDNLAAIYHAPKTIYEVGKAFALDEGIRSTGFKVMQELSEVV